MATDGPAEEPQDNQSGGSTFNIPNRTLIIGGAGGGVALVAVIVVVVLFVTGIIGGAGGGSSGARRRAGLHSSQRRIGSYRRQ